MTQSRHINRPRRPSVELQCEHCGRRFLRYASFVSSGRSFCNNNCRVDGTRKTLQERFIVKVHKTDTCWLWTGCKHPVLGYGSIGTGVGSKTMPAHRASYQIHIGPIPDGLHVLHRCDVRHCVNPEHLWIGTHSDNMADMAAKGRAVSGRRKS
jgi:hypothetical protein